jgi:tetratricopeptide (TPR) repeat protein
LAETDWDFAAVYYDALDHFSHIGMKFHPPKLNGVSDDDFKKYHYIVEGAYRFHDMMLERLIDLAGDNCNVMLVSDHGFINDHKRLLQLPDEPGAPAIEHRPYGVFIASGPQFISGPVYGASLLDVAPTILQFFGLPAARDFDGRTLNVLVDKPNNNLVDTYETDEDNSQASSVLTDIDDVLMQQLQDLGYVDKNIGAKNGKTVLVENEYYLARSLADGGQYDKAIKTIEPIAKAYPDAARYNQFYASLLLRTGNIELMEEYLFKSPPSPFNAYLKGLLLLQQQRPLLALEEFKRINSKANPAVACQIAKALLQAGQIAEAERAIQKLIKVDAENHQALNIAGDVAMQLEDWEGALTSYLKSIGLLFYQPTIHQQVGICLERLEYYHDAAQSFELALQFNPQNEAVKNLLIELYSNQVENPNRLAELKKSETQAEAIVVTGFPRSGTSMMMQLLQKGGIPILHDGTRKKDKNNPKGYLELEAVKRLAVDDSFMEEAPGKAIKIVMPLLRLLRPLYPLKVIWLERPLEAIVQSQNKMAGKESANLDLQLLMQMKHEQELMLEWLDRNPVVSYIRVDYNQAVNEPDRILKKLKSFLGEAFQAEKAKLEIDKSLKHF